MQCGAAVPVSCVGLCDSVTTARYDRIIRLVYGCVRKGTDRIVRLFLSYCSVGIMI